MERGAIAREESLSRTQPWAAAGISRATWYARRRAECSEIPAACRPEAAVGQIRPPAYKEEGFALGGAEVVHLSARREGSAVEDCRADPDSEVREREPVETTVRADGNRAGDHVRGGAADQQADRIAPDFHGYHLALFRVTQHKSLPILDSQYAKAHPEIADPAFRDIRVKIYKAHKMRVLKTISDKEFTARLKEAAPWPPSPPNADPAEVDSKPASSPSPELARLREIVNRLRWERDLPTKLSIDEIVRRVAPSEEHDEAREEQERDRLRARYDRMADQLLTDQIGDNEELPSRLAGDLEELLDWSERPRRLLIRSRLINLLVDRELAA
jgi:hypothetical protein